MQEAKSQRRDVEVVRESERLTITRSGAGVHFGDPWDSDRLLVKTLEPSY